MTVTHNTFYGVQYGCNVKMYLTVLTGLDYGKIKLRWYVYRSSIAKISMRQYIAVRSIAVKTNICGPVWILLHRAQHASPAVPKLFSTPYTGFVRHVAVHHPGPEEDGSSPIKTYGIGLSTCDRGSESGRPKVSFSSTFLSEQWLKISDEEPSVQTSAQRNS